MTDLAQLAHQAMELAKPLLPVLATKAAEGAASQTGKSFIDWLKSKLTSPAAAEALDDAARNPSSAANLQALEAQVHKLLERDEGFRKELVERLPQSNALASQVATAIGGSTVVQSTGSHVNIDVKK